MKKLDKAIKYALALLALVVLALPGKVQAQSMENYCISPPLIGVPTMPNLLLMLDNSSSMFDLTYVDEGKPGICSTLTTKTCYQNADCLAGEGTCSGSPRDPNYCYDQTYKSTNNYVGYFDKDKFYQYDNAVGDFYEIAAFPADASCAGTIKKITNPTNTLFICHTTTTVTLFAAKGNYLNWLTASKFDVQKEILTGGKYVTKVCSIAVDTSCIQDTDCPTGGGTCTVDPFDFLQGESRGCVGRGFIKEALTADFVNYADTSPNPNTSLGITFSIKGPIDETNPTSPSPGGQTSIGVLLGNYNESLCQKAIDVLANPLSGNAEIKKAVDDCLYSPTTTLVSKTKVVFQQSMQACWAYGNGTPIGGDDANTVKTKCSDIYDENHTCIGGDDHGKICPLTGPCRGVDAKCINGPDAILPGNPAYLCSRAYTGFCATSATSENQYKTTIWTGDECIIQKHRDFCNIMTAPEVIDPTDDPSVTEEYGNLPAIISDIGVEAQLGQPLKNLKVRVREATPPTNLIHQFKDLIRMGAMTFNFNGSAAECASGLIPCPKVCSTDPSKVCGSNFDCPSPATATCAVTTNNFDGSRVLHYIGKGKCSVSTSTECTTAANCPSGEKCVSDGVGNHTTGLIRAIDDVRGSTWTPFAEAYYNAIGYMATDRKCNNSATTRCTRDSDCPSGGTCPASTGLSRTEDLRINAADFVANRNPSEYMCQKNNILLITDGMSTADQRSSASSLAALYAPAAVRTPGPAGEVTTSPAFATGCEFAGSKNLDDLAWIGRHRNINTFSTLVASPTNTAPRSSDYITTHVVFAGAKSNATGDCDSGTLLTKTAASGGTELKTARDPEKLNDALKKALWEISAGATSGTAASVLASGEGSGANLIQAIFYPTKKFFNSATNTYDEITWTGRLTNLWYYVDPNFAQSSLREDDGLPVGGPYVFNLKTADSLTGTGSKDFVTKMYYDEASETAKAKRWADTNGDGIPDGTPLEPDGFPIENIKSLWEAGTLLWKKDAGTRKIYTSTGVPI